MCTAPGARLVRAMVHGDSGLKGGRHLGHNNQHSFVLPRGRFPFSFLEFWVSKAFSSSSLIEVSIMSM